MTSLIRWHVPSSIPLSRLTSRAPAGISGAQAIRLVRSDCAGTANTTKSAWARASIGSAVASRAGVSAIPGRYSGFSCRCMSAAASSGLRLHSVVRVPASHST
jgi:hypothetical protein